MAQKIYFNWSSGKDASMALYTLLKDSSNSVECLLTTLNEEHDRITMHGLSRAILTAQTKSLGIPLSTIELPLNTDMETYDQLMHKKLTELKKEGYTHAGFGDIFLEDLRNYRENQLAIAGLKPIFPLWKKDTKALIHEFINDGFKAVIICIDAQKLDQEFLGREIDLNFLNDLPDDVDPCGENGEFHTFCYDGPLFDYPIEFEMGEQVYRSYDQGENSHEFWFQDLLLK